MSVIWPARPARQGDEVHKYLEVYGAQVVGQLGVLCSCRISVAQEDVMQPVWQHCLLIHEVPNALQHRLEIVLLQKTYENTISIHGNAMRIPNALP